MRGKARAYTNIALIKYWGKTDDELILPTTSSLSLTLDAFYTETSVTAAETEQFFLSGQLQDAAATSKVQKFADLFRQLAGSTQPLKIESTNFVPTAAGLASSASGLAALAGALNMYFDLALTTSELSRLTRRGSGSACRSIYGGFAEWTMGDDQTSYARPIADDGWHDDLAMIFILLDATEKKVSSRVGMKRTVETSAFYPAWITSSATDLVAMKAAIAKKDFQQLGEITEASTLKMHGTTLAAVPPFTYWNGETVTVMAHVQQLREQGLPCYFTMDAGPNVKVLVEKKNQAAVLDYLRNFYTQEQLVTATAGPGIEMWKEE